MGCGSSKNKVGVVEPKQTNQVSTTSSKHSKNESQSNQSTNVKSNNAKNKQLIEEVDVENDDVTDDDSVFTKDVEILKCTPVKQDWYMKIEDTFWEKKRKLIPDYSVMLKLDQHAVQAPSKLKTDPDKLVNYLMKPAKSDLEKLRLIVRWIGENIAYDVQGRDDGTADGSLAAVLRTGKAVCEGYANVVSALCGLAGLTCEKLHGMTKNGEELNKYENIRTSPNSTHAWNRILLHGEWHLVDSTWCAGSVGKVYAKEWNERWFLSRPEAFIYTHLPMEGRDEISIEHQMIKHPYTSAEVWDTMVRRSPQSYELGIEPLNYPNARITTSEKEIHIKFTSKTRLHFYLNIEKQERKGNTLSSTEIDNMWSMIYEEKGVYNVHFRFPSPGSYIIQISSEMKMSDTNKMIDGSLSYKVTSSSHSTKPFPKGVTHCWGAQMDFLGAGFKVIKPSSAIILTNNGFAKVKIKLPSKGCVPNLHDFCKSEYNKNSVNVIKLNQYVYGEKKGEFITYYIQCPEKGEYKFEMFPKYKNVDDGGYSIGVGILIISNADKPVLAPNANHVNILRKASGPQSKFFENGLSVNKISSTCEFEKPLCIRKTLKPKFLLADLYDKDGKVNDLLTKEDNENECIFTVKTPNVVGYYWLMLFVSDERYKSYKYIGSYCFPYKVPVMDQ